MALAFGVLGPLRVWTEGEELDVGPPGPRAVLATLLLAGGDPVPRDLIIDAVWGERAPATAANVVHKYVAGLRRALDRGDRGDPGEGPGAPGRGDRGNPGAPGAPAGPGGRPGRAAREQRLVSTAGGYLLRVSEDELDSLRFLRLIERARELRAGGDGEQALRLLEEALDLWRGTCLADLDGAIRSHAAVAALDRQWFATVLELAEVALDLGRYDRAVPHLRAAAERDPLHEAVHALLVLALAGTGQQAAALEVYDRVRRRLRDELGIDPSSELRAAHQRVLRQELPAPAATAPPARALRVPAPAQLPADVHDFTGRDRELARLGDLLARGQGHDHDRESAVVVAAISGPAGVGKTALAVHAAHRLAAGFPDGQLVADLHGVRARPAAPDEVLGAFLRALGVPPGDVPDGEAERVARYRTMLAGRRMLVVLDNARDAAQVRPLLPGSPTCGVLVTSRQRLTGLAGARHLELEVLRPADAVALLGRVAGPERVAAEPQAAAAVVQACSGLPLAVRIAGARLVARRGWTVRTLADRLADQHHRLDELQLDDLAVRASFNVGYQRLDGEQRRAFRLLGLLDAADVGLATAAALLERPAARAGAILEQLVDVHLLESPAPERYRMHDLLRLFAGERAAADEPVEERTAAVRRAVESCIVAAHQADELIRPGRIQVRPLRDGPTLSPALDRDGALAWLETERRTLLALIHQAAGTPALGAGLAGCLLDPVGGFLELRGYWSDWERAVAAVTEAAVRDGDRRTEGRTRNDLGHIAWRRYRLEEAVDHLEAAMRLCRDAGDKVGESRALNILGNVHCDRRQYEQAIACYLRNLALLRDLGERRVGATWGNLGVAYAGLDRHEEAIACFNRTLAMHREQGERWGEAIDLNNLGASYHQLGRYREAIDLQERSIELCRAVGNQGSERIALLDLARGYRAVERVEDAVACGERALTISRELGDSHGEGLALWELGNAHHELGQGARAASFWKDALALLEALQAPEAAEVRLRLANQG